MQIPSNREKRKPFLMVLFCMLMRLKCIIH